MRSRKVLKVFISILCMLALLIGNFSPLSWGGNSFDEVQAADTVDLSSLDEITWSDFGVEEVYLCMDVTVNTTSEWTDDIGIRFDDYTYSANQVDMAITRYVSAGETTEMRFNAKDFAEEQAINGFSFVVFGGPFYEDYQKGTKMTMTISNVRLEGAVNKDIDMSSATWLKGEGDTGIVGANSLGDITYNEGTTTIANFCRFSGYKVEFEEAASTELETYLCMDMKITTLGGSTDAIPLQFGSQSFTGDINNLPVKASIDANAETELRFNLNDFLVDGSLKGFSFAIFDGPEWNTYLSDGTTPDRTTITISNVRLEGAVNKEIDMSAAAATWTKGTSGTGFAAGCNNFGTVSYDNGVTSITGGARYDAHKVTFAEAVTTEEETVVRFTVTGTSSNATTSPSATLRIYNSATTGQLGAIEDYKSYTLESGTKQTLDVEYDFLANAAGEIEGFTFATFDYAENSTYSFAIEQIAIVQGDKVIQECDISTNGMTWFKGGADQTGIDGNTCTGEATFADGVCTVSGCTRWTAHKFMFTEKLTAESENTVFDLQTLSTINNTLFNGDIELCSDGVFFYGAAESGLSFSVTESGGLLLSAADYEFSNSDIATEYQASVYGLDTFVNRRFNIKIATTNVMTDGSSATMTVWINNVMLGGGSFIITLKDSSDDAINQTMAFNTSGVFALDATAPDIIQVPTGLTDLTWEDFGITCIGEYTVSETEQIFNTYQLTSTKTISGSLFNGDITMQAGADIRYAGSENWKGLYIAVDDSGNLVLDGVGYTSDSLQTNTYEAKAFGMSSFINTTFNLKIAITESTDSSVTVGVWVNDIIVGDYFTLTGEGVLGNYVTFRNGTIEPHSILEKPTGLKDIKFGDWNVEVYDDNLLTTDETSTGQHPDVATLVGTSLKENIKFSGTTSDSIDAYIFCYGGLQGDNKTWLGLRFGFVGDQICIYNASESASYVDHVYLDAAKVGIDGFSFYGREYLWQVDITAQGNHVLVWMYFDGHLYGGAPIVIKDLADKMASSLVFYPKPNSVEQPATLGVSEKTLSGLYHDLDESGYIIPSGVIAMQKKNIAANGEVTWNDMTVEGGDTITVAGDYKIKYNDEVSNYIQEVYLWRSGDTKINDQNTIGAADLVRLIKHVNGSVDNAYECEKRAYDVDGDYAVDENGNFTVDTNKDTTKNIDVVTLREMILGTYKEGTSTKMPIVGYVGPSGDTVTDEVYHKIQQAGITIIVDNGNEGAYSDVPSSRYYTYEQLTLAQKYGLKMYVPDNRLKENRASISETDTTAVTDAIKHYKDYQSFAGSFICDEPWPYTDDQIEDAAAKGEDITVYEEYETLAQAINGVKVDGQAMYGYSNAMGYLYSRVNNKTAAYQYVDYLDSYVKDYQIPFLSSTHYPFNTESDYVPDEGAALDGSDYFKNFALNRYVANNNKIPFWSFVQAGDSFEFTSDDRKLLEGEFKWSANMGLAFGSKGIQYFTMMQPNGFDKSNGLITNTGIESGYYDWAIDVNTQVAAIDDILMNATNKGIMTTGTHATEQAADNVDEIELYESDGLFASSKGDVGMSVYNDSSGYEGATVTCTETEYGALTGCFETADGKHALYIVNYNPKIENSVTVNVGSGVTATIIQDGNTTEATGSATVTLGAGEAVLVVY